MGTSTAIVDCAVALFPVNDQFHPSSRKAKLVRLITANIQ